MNFFGASQKIQLFNFNTELETTLFWIRTKAEVETSLLCFSSLSTMATSILDVGANTGIFAIVAASVNRVAKTFAIEPNFSNFVALKQNVRRNDLPVNCLNVAATSESRLVTLWDFDYEISYSASLEREFREGQGTRAVDVIGVRLDQILVDVGANDLILAKIDVESHEAEVVRGMSTVLDDDRCQIVFLIEVIRESVCRDLGHLLPPSRFAYFQVREESRELLEVVDLSTFDGFNYLIVSRNILPKVLAKLESVFVSAKLQSPGLLRSPV